VIERRGFTPQGIGGGGQEMKPIAHQSPPVWKPSDVCPLISRIRATDASDERFDSTKPEINPFKGRYQYVPDFHRTCR